MANFHSGYFVDGGQDPPYNLFHSDAFLDEVDEEGVPLPSEDLLPESGSVCDLAFSGDEKGIAKLMSNLQTTEKSQQLNGSDFDKRTPLHLAAAQGHTTTVKLLIDMGANLEAVDRWGTTPIQDAIMNGHTDVVNLLQKHGAKRPELELAASVNICAARGDISAVSLYLAAGVGVSAPDYDKRTALHVAAAEGHLELVKLLVEQKADLAALDRWERAPVDEAVDRGHLNIVRYLQKKGAPLDRSESKTREHANKLCAAAHDGNLEQCKKLVELMSVDINAPSFDKRTPLHLASAEGHLEVVQYLLEKGADSTLRDRWRRTPYQDAVLYGHEEIARELSKGGEVFVEIRGLDRMDPAEWDMESCCKRYGDNRRHVHKVLKHVLACAAMAGGEEGDEEAYPWDYAETWTYRPDLLCMEVCEETTFFHPSPYPGQEFHRPRAHMPIQPASLEAFGKATKGLLIESDMVVGCDVAVTRRPCWRTSLHTASQTMVLRAPCASASGLRTCVAVPIETAAGVGGPMLGVAVFFSRRDIPSNKTTEDFLAKVCAMGGELASLLAMGASVPMRKYCDAIKELVEFSDDRMDLLSLLLETKVLDQVLAWGMGMNSEEHKPVTPVLVALGKRGAALAKQPLWVNIREKVERCLMFLKLTSPRASLKTPVREMVDGAIKDMSAAGLIDVDSSVAYFSPSSGRLSPVVEEMFKMRAKLCEIFATYGALPVAEPSGEAKLTVSDIFTTFGRNSTAETENVCKLANEVLQSGQLFSIEKLLLLHSGVELDGSSQKGAMRKVLAVGSFQHYRFYRVFCPHEEVQTALQMVADDVQSPEVQAWHAVHRAFYMYSAVVHYIHPFQDGNGRISRLLANMELVKHGFPAVFQFKDKVTTVDEILKRVSMYMKIRAQSR